MLTGLFMIPLFRRVGVQSLRCRAVGYSVSASPSSGTEGSQSNISEPAWGATHRETGPTAAASGETQPVQEFKASKELRERLEVEYRKLVNEFAVDHKFTAEIDEIVVAGYRPTASIDEVLYPRLSRSAIDGNMEGELKFPSLLGTSAEEPYSPQELYLRRQFHASLTANIGATVEKVYRPHENRTKPKSIEETGVATLLAAGAHLGHHCSLSKATMIPHVKGRRDTIHIIDLEHTLTSLRRAAAVTEKIAEKGGLILFVGTRENHRDVVTSAARRCNGFYVHRRWIPGTLSNSLDISQNWPRREVDMADEPTGRELGEALKIACVKPDMVVILNPVENRPLINESISQRVPTIAICDTNMDPALITYPIFANDDSLRTCDLIAGVLSSSARRGRETRIDDFKSFNTSQDRVISGEAINSRAYVMDPAVEEPGRS